MVVILNSVSNPIQVTTRGKTKFLTAVTENRR